MQGLMLPVAVFAALPWECKCVLPALRGVRRGRSGAFKWWEGNAGPFRVRLVQTGIGIERATKATNTVLNEFPCTLVVSTGCAGGLTATLEVGALVIASEIVCGVTGSVFSVAEPVVASFAEATNGSGLKYVIGRQLCVSKPLASVAAKQQAAIRFQALAVDMESAAIMREAASRGIAFASVRAVLDPALKELPPTDGLVDPASGRVRPGSLLRQVIRGGPARWQELHELYNWVQFAQSTLTRFYGRWFASRSTPTWSLPPGQS